MSAGVGGAPTVPLPCCHEIDVLSDSYTVMGWISSVWRSQLHLWEVGPIASGVSREQREILYGGMRADVEVRQGRRRGAAVAAVGEERLAGEEGGRPREGSASEVVWAECIVKVLDA